MACACANKRKPKMNDDVTVEPIVPVEKQEESKQIEPIQNKNVRAPEFANESEKEAYLLNLKQCYLCAKKHIVRAQELFQEYHTGYPDHIKNLADSVRVAELDVKNAFLLWQRTMGQLNMGEGELLGRNANSLKMREEHLSLANRIRNERIKLSDNPLYVPDFDQLLVDIQILQHRILELS